MSKYQHDVEHPIIIPYRNVLLDGILQIPEHATGLVIFVHGSGSSRFSVRNQFVARTLNKAKLATLLFDLLTPDEDQIDAQTAEYRFDITFLAARLLGVTDWVQQHLAEHTINIGYFGASTGGAAALVAAAERVDLIKAVVSRGGRPDLADASLPQVRAPTLLIVGGDDPIVIQLNQTAFQQLDCVKELKIIPGATHLFEEPGTLEAVAALAQQWFKKYLI